MFTLWVALGMAAVPQQTICEVGRVALTDIYKHRTGEPEWFYAMGSESNPDLLMACPAFQTALPAGYRLADEVALARVSHRAETDPSLKPTSVYTVSVPKFSADGRTATVDFTTRCLGLCGGAQQATYVRTPTGWQRQGGLSTLWVS